MHYRRAQPLDESHRLPLQTPLEPKSKHIPKKKKKKHKTQSKQRETLYPPARNPVANNTIFWCSLRLPSAGAGGEELDEVVGGHVEERVEVHAVVAVLAERPLLGLPRGGDLRLDVNVRLRGTITRGEGLVSSATAKCVRVVDSRAGRGCELWPLTMAAVGLEERRGREAEARRGSGGGGGGVLGFAGKGRGYNIRCSNPLGDGPLEFAKPFDIGPPAQRSP
jgi:hypothetical protein